MFGKIMNSFYYGKSGKGDYTREDLPQNRWQLFWEMLKIRLSGLCRLNLIYAVIWLPAIVLVFAGLSQWYAALAGIDQLQSAAAQDPAAAETLGEALAQFGDWTRALVLQTLVCLIPCLAITGPFTAGVAYVTRNWARDEHAFVWSDFWDAVKGNWRQGLAVSAVTGVMPLVLYVCWSFYGDMARESLLFIVPQVLSAMLAVAWLCSLLFQYPLMVTYRLRFRELLRNALLLTVGRLPMVVGFKLLSLAPVAIAALVALFTPYLQYGMLALGAYYLLFGFSLSRFVGASYANAVFDRFINPHIEGAQVGRGLYREDGEDWEDSQADAP